MVTDRGGQVARAVGERELVVWVKKADGLRRPLFQFKPYSTAGPCAEISEGVPTFVKRKAKRI